MAAPARVPNLPWADDFPCAGLDEVQLSDAEIDDYLARATELLWALSGRRYGLSVDTVRPCRPSPGAAVWWRDMFGVWSYPTVASFTSAELRTGAFGGCHSTSCACDRPTELILPRKPVAAVTEVLVDGVVLDPSVYRVDDWRRLVRLDDGTWPTCQNMVADVDQADTFQVTYEWGRTPPPGGVAAVKVMACELAKAEHGQECDLPQRVTAITRQGLAIQVQEPNDFLENGKTGVYLADVWLAAVNPGGAKRPPGVFRADVTTRRTRRTGT